MTITRSNEARRESKAPTPPPAPAATLVIFGATGDLTHRLLMPSLIYMTSAGLVDDGLQVIGLGRSDLDDEAFRNSFEQFAGEAGGEGAGWQKDPAHLASWRRLRGRIRYRRGDFGDAQTFEELKADLVGASAANVVFYLATAPELFGPVAEQLAKAGLLKEEAGFRRLAVEKPFGHDLASAEALNRKLLGLIDESQIYRVDHFLGKETVQNIMVARFANTLIEAVWNAHYIDHVQITAAETVDVGRRGEFYDAAGALRDMVPNHLFQLLAMVCMEPPNSFDAEAVRNEKAKVFRAIRGPRLGKVAQAAVRGVYTAGEVGGNSVGDYRKADGIAADSRTETYVALKLFVDSWRWAGVPFYLRTGKAMSHRDTEVVVVFKPVPFAQFRGTDIAKLPPNRLVIQIQPDEGMALDFSAKRPGPAIDTAPVRMRFRYADQFELAASTGYETLLYDLLLGDQTLFQRADGVESAWRAVQPILDAWAAGGEPEPYAAGTAGPDAADRLLASDGRQWHELGS
ncbi:Glucose-6-phosphate 1-dehydrogenase [Burkholderiales bacterium 8X]|nr:Glucose-6-phosphate 1-dehydrogenase [Burkholderiales bacterium 8X]